MRIGSSREAAFGYDDRRPETPRASSESQCRALTVIAAPALHEPPALTRGDAAFLAHLIATKAQLPQTRLKRRAEPEEALAVYRHMARLMR